MAWAGIINRAFTADTIGAYLHSLPRPSFVQFVVVHNTGAPSLATYRGYANRKNPISDAQWLRNLEGYYRDKQKWKAGPHWFVTPNEAGILAFTPSTSPGTHSPSWNSRSLGVEMVGNYQSEPFEVGVRRNTIALLAELHIWLDLDPGTIRFHREDAKTTHKDCPGKNVNKTQLIADVRTKMAEIKAVRIDATKIVADGVSAEKTEAVPAGTDVPIDMPSEADPEPAPVEPAAPVKAGRVAGWSLGGVGVGFLTYLTDWRIAAEFFTALFVMGVAAIWFMGPADVRAWVKRQVS